MSYNEFLNITPRVLNIYLAAYNEKKETENKESIFQAYLISRWVWQKKINIEKILETKKEKKVMSDEEMLQQVKVLNRLFGGTTNTCNP